MKLGAGDIASVVPDDDRFLFFFSGVSNSQETRESEFSRERDLLLAQDRNAHIVYCSTLAVFYGDTAYVHHKKMMEGLIKGLFPRYCILRIGNITWGNNPHTLINFFKEQRARGEELVVQDVYRYIVDEQEFLYWVGLIPDEWSCEMNIPGERLKVAEVVERYV